MFVCFNSFRLFIHSLLFVILFLYCALFPACHIVRGTMHGSHLGNNQFTLLGRPHCSDPHLYIFVAYHDKYYKMTAVSVENAKASTKPSTPVDSYIQAARNSINSDDDATLCKMWDGDGYSTLTLQSDGYELKDVTVTACGSYMAMCAHMCESSEPHTQFDPALNLINVYMNLRNIEYGHMHVSLHASSMRSDHSAYVMNRTECFMPSLTIGNLACAAGFNLVPGDVAGSGTLCNQGGGEEVSECADCAAKCLACDGCRSYECSVTQLKCNLNTEPKPSTDKNNIDYAFCERGRKQRGGTFCVVLCMRAVLMNLQGCKFTISLTYPRARALACAPRYPRTPTHSFHL